MAIKGRINKKENGRTKSVNILRIKSIQKDPKTSESLVPFTDYTQLVFLMSLAQITPEMRRSSG